MYRGRRRRRGGGGAGAGTGAGDGGGGAGSVQTHRCSGRCCVHVRDEEERPTKCSSASPCCQCCPGRHEEQGAGSSPPADGGDPDGPVHERACGRGRWGSTLRLHMMGSAIFGQSTRGHPAAGHTGIARQIARRRGHAAYTDEFRSSKCCCVCAKVCMPDCLGSGVAWRVLFAVRDRDLNGAINILLRAAHVLATVGNTDTVFETEEQLEAACVPTPWRRSTPAEELGGGGGAQS